MFSIPLFLLVIMNGMIDTVKKRYRAIGMMSGTSLDGIDLSLCTYAQFDAKWVIQRIHKVKLFEYPQHIVCNIKQMYNEMCGVIKFRKLELQYSQFIVKCVSEFIANDEESLMIGKDDIDFVCIHGHTIFHQPSINITVQAANLNYIAAKLQMDVIGNFRELDVCRGGQGAPLVPYGQQLFTKHTGSHQAFVNLGGVANIGFKGQGTDISFCNIVLNQLSKLINGKPYDQQGKLGSSGTVDEHFYEQIKEQFRWKYGQSLRREGIQPFLTQKCFKSQPMLLNMLTTFYQFIADQIVNNTHTFITQVGQQDGEYQILCTGGGSYNSYLLSLLHNKTKLKNEESNIKLNFVIGSKQLIEFKQAIIFGFLGVKFIIGGRNCERGTGGMFVKGSNIFA